MVLQALDRIGRAAAVQPLRIYAGIASSSVVIVYPFMKRVTYWPQIFLGLSFSWGALMGWAAAFGRLDASAYLLYAGSISWVIAYDTIYAHQDREDDALVGLKSTAILFADHTRPMLAVFFSAAVVLIAMARVERRWRGNVVPRIGGVCLVFGLAGLRGSIPPTLAYA